MGKKFAGQRTMNEKVREEKIVLVMKLRDEQHLSFKQISAQIGMSWEWCRNIYCENKRTNS